MRGAPTARRQRRYVAPLRETCLVMKRLIDFGRWLVKHLFPRVEHSSFRSTVVEELPDTIHPGVLYAIGSGAPWSAALLCPCHCGALIQLSLLKHERPHWDLCLTRGGAPTLYPSVWRTQGCKAHFLLRGGQVIWCETSQELRTN
jgi:hypothetical protein